MPERSTELVAVFPDDAAAQAAVRRLVAAGVRRDQIRIGDSMDALASVRGEMREEVNHVPAMPAPATRETFRGAVMGSVVGGIIGFLAFLPLAAIEIGNLNLIARLALLGAIGALFGSFLGGFLAGAFAIERPDEPLAAQSGTTVAVADSKTTRRSLADLGATRVDVVRLDGQAVDTEVTNDEGPRATPRHIRDHADRETRPRSNPG
jgi:hypothetical protein